MTRRTNDDDPADPAGPGDRREQTEWPAGDPEVTWTPDKTALRGAPHDETWWSDEDDAWPADDGDAWPTPPAVRRGAALADGGEPFDLGALDEGVLDLSGPDDDLPDSPSQPLTTPAATLECLLALVGPERHGPPAIWLLPVDAERHALPFVLPVAEVTERADGRVAARLVGAVASVLEAAVAGGGAIVAGLVRSAGGDRGPFETSWACALRDAADERGVDVHAVVAIGASRARVLEW
ncbi:hypothetical protein [Cellulomonas alba]|uniref:Uncharacterized protein n=1 Tax=Cellulomonas alba TaxID=3053467 RepID=A0ABT7SB47_9CELL|nr:hypothetical protein [Cellulomonas alba]MDM7853351.1 hypothetical protein [Cellulomonas alba]